MRLMFLQKLDKKQIIDLINYVNLQETANYNPIVDVSIYNEPERCDEEGEQQIYVEAIRKNNHIDTYLIKDFTMTKALDGIRSKHFDPYLREFMANIFGESYFEGLKLYYAYSLKKEINRLKRVVKEEKASYFKKA